MTGFKSAVPEGVMDSALEVDLAVRMAEVESALRDAVRSEYPFVTEASRYLVDAGGKATHFVSTSHSLSESLRRRHDGGYDAQLIVGDAWSSVLRESRPYRQYCRR